MTFTRFAISAMICLLPVCAADSCNLPALENQRMDVPTVQRLEDEWSKAFLRGDTRFMSCLLIPEFTEVTRSGELKYRADELAMTAANRGKNPTNPKLPKAEVLLHGNVAVAYGESLTAGADGKARPRRFADSFIWENGKWRAFFSQQTPVASP